MAGEELRELARETVSVQLQGRTALVTGAGSGIGEGIAKRFAREGARVVVADVVPERVERVTNEIESDGGTALASVFDVADAVAVASAIESSIGNIGTIDLLVNNAAVSMGDDILTIEPETWDRNVGIVLRGPYLCTRAVLPGMIDGRRGAIVNIASVNGMTGLGEEPYSAAKAGLINFTQNLAIRYGEFGIRANAIAPGTIRTPIWNARLAEAPDVFETLAPWYPLGRVGEVEDVVNAALFLASDAASFITGVTLPVDGGLLAGSYRMNRDLQGSSNRGGS